VSIFSSKSDGVPAKMRGQLPADPLTHHTKLKMGHPYRFQLARSLQAEIPVHFSARSVPHPEDAPQKNCGVITIAHPLRQRNRAVKQS
jgi:hypothetical protein